MSEAARSFEELIQDARAGRIQRIKDENGIFEVTFKEGVAKPRIGEVLARGGPDTD